jgi:ketosteroid isomerase-like protein
MSQENIEIVRRIFRAWEGGGSPLDSGLIADDIEWVNDRRAVEPGTRRGAAAFDTAAGSVSSTFPGVRIDFERFVDAGDQVVVIGTLHAAGAASGIELGRRQGYLWTIRDGKAVRFEWFNDPDEALRAAGVED